MSYAPQNFDRLIGTPGFSDTLLKNHFTLYQGYVTNTNKLIEKLGGFLKEGKTAEPEYTELKRRFGWEFDGMRMHEIYFGNMSKSPVATPKDTPLFKKITEDFGSWEAWEKDFRAVSAMRGVGWSLLAYDKAGGRLFNTWIHEHDGGHLAGGVPVLLMDVWEHAFMIDYGLKRADYIEAFFKAIDWKVAADRFSAPSK